MENNVQHVISQASLAQDFYTRLHSKIIFILNGYITMYVHSPATWRYMSKFYRNELSFGTV